MANSHGSFTIGTTGTNIDLILGFQPSDLTFTAFARGATSTNIQWYFGSVDSTGYQGAGMLYGDDGVIEDSRRYFANDRCIYIREYVSGAWVTRVHAVFGSFLPNGIRFSNVIAADINFAIWCEARS